MNTNAKKTTLVNSLKTLVKVRLNNGKMLPTCGVSGGGHSHGQTCSGLF